MQMSDPDTTYLNRLLQYLRPYINCLVHISTALIIHRLGTQQSSD